MNDYLQRMNNAADELKMLQGIFLYHLIHNNHDSSSKNTLTVDLYTLSAINTATQVTSTTSTSVRYHPIVLFNSLAWNRTEVVTIQVDSRNIKVYRAKDQLQILCQIDPFWTSLTEINPSQSIFLVSFRINILPFATETYFIQISSAPVSAGSTTDPLVYQSVARILTVGNSGGNVGNAISSKYIRYEALASFHINNKNIQLDFDSTAALTYVTDLHTSTRHVLRYYLAHYATNQGGAYLFRPLEANAQPKAADVTTVRIIEGPITNNIRLLSANKFPIIYKLDNHEEDTFTIDTAVSAEGNEELVVSISTDLGSAGHCQSHNGLHWMNRQYKQSSPHPANFYPAVAGARLQSPTDGTTLTVWTQHTHSVGCIGDDKLDFVVHRQLLQDDRRGLSEAINDATVQNIVHTIQLTTNRQRQSHTSFMRRHLKLNHPLVTALSAKPVDSTSTTSSSTTTTAADDSTRSTDEVTSMKSWLQEHVASHQFLRAALPAHLHIFTLQSRDSVTDAVAIRVQNLRAATDDIDDDGSTLVSEGDRVVLPTLFSKDYIVSEVRLTTAALTSMPAIDRDWSYLRSGVKIVSSNIIGGGGDASNDGDRQNTEEAGVFISEAALRLEREAKAKADANKKLPITHRRLLVSEHEHSADVALVVHNGRIASGVIRLTGAGSEQGDSHEHNPNGALLFPTNLIKTNPNNNNNINNNNNNYNQEGNNIKASYNSEDTVDNNNDNSATRSTVFPTITSTPTWKVIPSRLEYLFVLCLSVGAVGFFIHIITVSSTTATTTSASSPNAYLPTYVVAVLHVLYSRMTGLFSTNGRRTIENKDASL